MMTSASAVTSAPPIVHAIGGSLGSALALVLFYPLERARIELQAQASVIPSSSSSVSPSVPPVASSPPTTTTGPMSEHQQQQHDVVVAKNLSGDDGSWSLSSYHNDDNIKLVNVGTTAARTDDTSWTSCLEEEGFADQTLGPNQIGAAGVAVSAAATTTTTRSTVPQPPPSSSWSDDDSSTTTTTTTLPNEHNGIDHSDHKEMALAPSGPSSRPLQSSKYTLVRCLLDLHSRGMLYQGVTPIMTTIFTSQFIFFFMQAYVKKLLQATTFFRTAMMIGPSTSQQYPALLSLLSSCIAGVGNVLLTNPLWVTNMAIVTGETKTQNLVKELIGLYRHRGIAHLWDGTSASIWLVSNPIIQFFCYEQFKHARLTSLLLHRHHGTSGSTGSTAGGASSIKEAAAPVALSAIEALFLAALAKGIATITTYPLQLTQTLLRLGDDNNNTENNNTTEHTTAVAKTTNDMDRQEKQHHQHHRRYKGTIDCLIQLYRTNNKGVAGWYTGMRAKLLQTVLTAAFTFLTYEQILGAIQKIIFLRQTIVTAAVTATAAATTATP